MITIRITGPAGSGKLKFAAAIVRVCDQYSLPYMHFEEEKAVNKSAIKKAKPAVVIIEETNGNR